MYEKILNKLQFYREQKGMSLEELSKKTGISYTYLKQLHSRTKNTPSLDTIYKITSALNIEFSDLFEE